LGGNFLKIVYSLLAGEGQGALFLPGVENTAGKNLQLLSETICKSTLILLVTSWNHNRHVFSTNRANLPELVSVQHKKTNIQETWRPLLTLQGPRSFEKNSENVFLPQNG
jgi:hypothetical protein